MLKQADGVLVTSATLRAGEGWSAAEARTGAAHLAAAPEHFEADSPFADLIGWMQNNLERPLDVPTLAARAGLGERSFYRRFLAATGSSPAHFVEALRLEAARTLVDGNLPLKGVAARVGLSPIRLNQAFERRFGIAPRLFRDMHRRTPVPPANRSGVRSSR